jgi:hypothetical protein
MTGAQVGQGLEQVGEGARRAGEFFGQVAADDAFNSFQDRANKILHGDPNVMVTGPDGKPTPDTGYLGLRGRAALDQRKAYEDKMDALLRETRSGLTTGGQQFHFDTYSRRYRSVISSQMGTHADSQANVYAQGVAKSQAEVNLNTISANPDDPAIFGSAREDVIDGFVKLAQHNGAVPGDLQWQAAIIDGKRAARRAQILAIGAKDPGRAASMVDQFRGELGPDYQKLSDHYRDREETEGGGNDGVAIYKATVPGVSGAPAPAAAGKANAETQAALDGLKKAARDAGLPIPADSNISTYRPPPGAGQAGGRQSLHPQGQAFDWPVAPGMSQQQLEATFDAIAKQPGVTQIGFEGNHFHVGTGNIGNRARAFGPNRRDLSDAPAWFVQKVQAWQSGKATAQNQTAASPATTEPPPAAGVPVPAVGGGTAVPPIPSAPSAPAPSPVANPSETTDPQPPPEVNGAVIAAQRRASAIEQVVNSDWSAKRKNAAIHMINELATADQLKWAAEEKANKDAVDRGMDSYIKQLAPGQIVPPGIVKQITDDPRFNSNPRVREMMINLAKQHSGNDVQEAAQAYGPGYWDLAKKPGIMTPEELLEHTGPGGDLTVAGYEKLKGIMADKRKGADPHAIINMQNGFIAEAKKRLSFQGEGEMGTFKGLEDREGENIFHTTFLPTFYKAYDEWVGGKNPKPAYEFFTKKNLDAMIAPLRDQKKMARDRLMAGAQQGQPQPRQPTPPTPEGVNEDTWQSIMNTPPINKLGAEYPQDVWATIVSDLRANPSPENIRLFNKYIGASGHTAENLIERLKKAPTSPVDKENAFLGVHP